MIPVEGSVLSRMREKGGTWFAYAPSCSDTSDDRIRYLRVGPRGPYRRPPGRFPDTNHLGSGFSHLLAGVVDLESGLVLDLDAAPTANSGEVS